MARATLETTPGCGHNWDGFRLCALGASMRGSSAYSESEGASSGRRTSMNSPGHTVWDGAGARRTNALRAVA